MAKDLKLYTHHIYKHFNTIDEFKNYMEYNDKNDLIDNRGDYNASLYELLTANFLIAQGLGNSYKREVSPFKQFDSKIDYRSDFTFYTSDGKEIHIEVWGVPLTKVNDSYSKHYNEKRKLKEQLYYRHREKLTLISIDFEVYQQSYNDLQKSLYDILSPYLTLKFKSISVDLIKPLNIYNENEIYSFLMDYSSDKNYLPSKDELKKDEFGVYLLGYITLKYNGINYFSKKFNTKMRYKANYWNDNTVFEKFLYMVNKYGKILNLYEFKEYNDEELNGLYRYIDRNKGRLYYKIAFVRYCLDNNLTISSDMIKLLNDVITNNVNGVNKIKDELVTLSQEILNKLNKIDNSKVS
jgi:hypothetical protein